MDIFLHKKNTLNVEYTQYIKIKIKPIIGKNIKEFNNEITKFIVSRICRERNMSILSYK